MKFLFLEQKNFKDLENIKQQNIRSKTSKYFWKQKEKHIYQIFLRIFFKDEFADVFLSKKNDFFLFFQRKKFFGQVEKFGKNIIFQRTFLFIKHKNIMKMLYTHQLYFVHLYFVVFPFQFHSFFM